MPARNDFAPPLGRAIKLDEDYRRETLDEIRQRRRLSPEEIREEAEQLATGVMRVVPCPYCGAAIGEPCDGLKLDVVHFDRGAAYARRGGS